MTQNKLRLALRVEVLISMSKHSESHNTPNLWSVNRFDVSNKMSHIEKFRKHQKQLRCKQTKPRKRRYMSSKLLRIYEWSKTFEGQITRYLKSWIEEEFWEELRMLNRIFEGPHFSLYKSVKVIRNTTEIRLKAKGFIIKAD